LKATLLSLLVASASFAQDVPKVVVLAPGEAAPSQGLFLPEPVAVEQAKRVKACEAERAVLVENDKSRAVVVVLAIVGGMVVGGAVGAGVVVAVRK